jgi:hypothetical protein
VKPVLCDICPACAHGEPKVFIGPDTDRLARFHDLSRIKYNRFLDGWERVLSLQVLECPRCGHLWHHAQPDPDSLFGMYDAAVALRPHAATTSMAPAVRRQLLALYRLVRRQAVSEPTFLDYGSGKGAWAELASKCGFAVWAYEPSLNRSASGPKLPKCRFLNRAEDLKGNKYDLINLEQVLEHTPQPLQVLRSLKALSHPRTLVRISVPNIGRIKRRKDFLADYPFNGKTMHPMSPFEHLQGFSWKSFRMMVNLSGLAEVDLLTLAPTHPIFVLRRMAGYPVPALRQTLTLARFVF